MNNSPIDFSSSRYRSARYSKLIGHSGFIGLVSLGTICVIAAIALITLVHMKQIAGILAALALICYLPAIWWKQYLSVLPSTGASLTERLNIALLTKLSPKMPLNPQSVWQALKDHWQAIFFTNHLLLADELVTASLSTDPSILIEALTLASSLAEEHHTDTIEVGFVIAGLFMTDSNMQQLLAKQRGHAEDFKSIADWLGRNLGETTHMSTKTGGIGRDWAFGFTPLLDKLGRNVSLSVSGRGGTFTWLTKSQGVQAIETAFANHATAIALVGPTGVGKTSHIYALAQAMINGISPPSLRYHQIISLNATDITAVASGRGQLEQLMISLVNEAGRAGHIILFLDNAQLFLTEDAGSVNASQILFSIIEARAVPLILALTPQDFQNLKTTNAGLAGMLTPVMLAEMPENDIMRILEDNASRLEYRFNVLIPYEALREAYRLSGRYNQDEAYPGRAIKLLEQAVNHAEQGIISRLSVQHAVEQMYGVKASVAAPVEVDELLHLEDHIHERMINQSHAVSVVANSLRRARAGVTNPRRPIGSFLFLGPTGVGKTELAKAIAATYFRDENNMIRLDMTEYQRPDDVQRLLDSGSGEHSSLLLKVRQQPFSVVLLDEVEKAHPDILNLLLQMLDEGQLTDTTGRPASFKDCVIIATSNAGAETIRDRISQGQDLADFAKAFSDELIASGQFKPELINRFDELVLFRPLNPDELAQVVSLMLKDVNRTLAQQNISVELTPEAINKIVAAGNDPRLGARPMRRMLQRTVEDTVAKLILEGKVRPGDHVRLDETSLQL